MNPCAFLSCALLLSGCAQSSVYDVVARELVTLRVKGTSGYVGVWHPVDSTSTAARTPQQEEALQVAIQTCIEQLEAHQVWEQKEIVATAQLISCMRAKSWVLAIEQIIVAG